MGIGSAIHLQPLRTTNTRQSLRRIDLGSPLRHGHGLTKRFLDHLTRVPPIAHTEERDVFTNNLASP